MGYSRWDEEPSFTGGFGNRTDRQLRWRHLILMIMPQGHRDMSWGLLAVIIQYFSRYVRDSTRTVVWAYHISSTRVFMVRGSSCLSKISYLLLCVWAWEFENFRVQWTRESSLRHMSEKKKKVSLVLWMTLRWEKLQRLLCPHLWE